MKTNKIRAAMIAVAVVLLTAMNLQAQVRIGGSLTPEKGAVLDLHSSDYVGGLHLPNVNITDLGKIPADFTDTSVQNAETNTALTGMIVYNVGNATISKGVYVWDGEDWKAVASGSGNMTIDPKIPPIFPFPGGEEDIVVTSPDCDIIGSYSFTVIAGDATVSPESSIDGKFKVIFDANPFAMKRKAVVLVTDPCGNNASFVFEQAADESLCDPSVTGHSIASNGGTVICAGGSQFLYLSGSVTGVPNNYIWTKNNVELGRGRFYEAKSAGTYVVYYGAIGCETGKASINITSGGTYTGNMIDVLVAGNNGYVCDAGGMVSLMAIVANVADESKIVWFKDGVLQPSFNGLKSISANVGQWQAALKDGSCFSNGSRVVTVQVSPTPGGAPADFTIGLQSEICRNGNIIASVSGSGIPQAGVTYTWYANATLLGTGAEIVVPIPSEINNLATGAAVYIRCQAVAAGCPIEKMVSKTLLVSSNIPKADIVSSTNGIICDGSTVLSVSNSTGFTVNWYNSATATTPIHSGNSYPVTSTNSTVYAELRSGTCAGERGNYTTSNTVSNKPEVDWDRSYSNMNINEAASFTVKGYNLSESLGTSYSWSVTGADGSISGSGANVSVLFTSIGNKSVNVIVSNSCGSATVLSKAVTVGTACDPVTNVTISGSVSAYAGVPFTLTATATGGSGVSYKWYDNDVEVGTGSPVTLQTSDLGSHSYTVKAWASCQGEASAITSGSHSVAIAANPSTLPVYTGDAVFSGTTCFDVRMTQYPNNDCGEWNSRIKHDFATNYSLPYTFKANVAVTNVSFVWVNNHSTIPVVSSFANATPGSVAANTPYTLTVNYMTNLNAQATGKSGAAAPTATLYAIFTYNSVVYKKEILVTVQDCACCGAKIDNGKWLTFMCHNLGADEGLDPFTPAAGLHGDKFRFGAKEASLKMSDDQDSRTSVSGWSSKYVQTSGNWNSANDPCRAKGAWRLPTQSEWLQVMANNALSRMGTWRDDDSKYESGLKVGHRLFLPAAGRREGGNGSLFNRNYSGYYVTVGGQVLIIANKTNDVDSDAWRSYGLSVRCVAE